MPGLQRDEIEAGVGRRGSGEKAVARDRGDVLDALGLAEDLIDPLADRVRALQRRRVGQLDVHEEVPLVLHRQEAGGQLLAEEAAEDDEADQDCDADEHLPDEVARQADVALRHPSEDAVEPGEELPERPLGLLLRPQDQRAERRREREGIEGRDEDRDRDRDRELHVHPALDAAHEGHGNEHGGENEGDSDDRLGDLFHRLQRGVLRREAVLDVVLDRLDDDDRVVDDEADREDEAEQRQRVDREAEHRKEDERADERHGHGEQRDQRRAPALQEEEHDDDHEDRSPRRGCARSP